MKTKTIFLLAALSAILFFNENANAKIIRVNNQAIYDPDYTDLQTALDAAGTGDTIHVEASGTVYSPVTINNRIVLIGTGYFLDKNLNFQNNPTPATIQQITIKPQAAGTIINGLRIADHGYSRVYIQADNITIERCYIEDGIEFQNENPAVLNNIVIKQCYVQGRNFLPGYPGPINNLIIQNTYWNGELSLTKNQSGKKNNYTGKVTNCIFNGGVDNWSTSMVFEYNVNKAGTFNQNENSNTNVRNNLFVAASLPAWLTGGTNTFRASGVFIATTGSTDNDLHVRASAQCSECYIGGKETGIFGGADPYLLSGIPSIPAIYFLGAPANVLKGGNAPTDIKTRSNN